LIRLLIFLVVFGVILKVGIILALAAGAVAAFRFAYSLEGGAVLKTIAFIGAFALVLTVAVYFVGFAAFLLGTRAAMEA
jgi:hypothetical protein